MNRTAEIVPQQEERQPAREADRRDHEADQLAIHLAHGTREPISRGLLERSRGFLWAAAFLSLLFATACTKPAEEEKQPLETVDIDAPTDAALSFEGDVQAERRSEDLAGILPGGFPSDLPLFDPASIVDSSETSDGRMEVVLQHPATVEEVESFLDRELPMTGWQAQGGSSYRNDQGRMVDISVESLGAVSRARIVF